MPVIMVMYPSSGGATFDEGYYTQTHMKLVHRHWDSMGLSDVSLLRGVTAPDGAAPVYMMTALLTFGSVDAFKQAASAHGKEIFADIPNFTTAQPVIQFNEPLG